ncbi:hypothetical protein QQP08_016691 [Theobroma cacao]|nr:hypothetical protein QQP08_016691 [Theobroma cacao]
MSSACESIDPRILTIFIFYTLWMAFLGDNAAETWFGLFIVGYSCCPVMKLVETPKCRFSCISKGAMVM